MGFLSRDFWAIRFGRLKKGESDVDIQLRMIDCSSAELPHQYPNVAWNHSCRHYPLDAIVAEQKRACHLKKSEHHKEKNAPRQWARNAGPAACQFIDFAETFVECKRCILNQPKSAPYENPKKKSSGRKNKYLSCHHIITLLLFLRNPSQCSPQALFSSGAGSIIGRYIVNVEYCFDLIFVIKV